MKEQTKGFLLAVGLIVALAVGYWLVVAGKGFWLLAIGL